MGCRIFQISPITQSIKKEQIFSLCMLFLQNPIIFLYFALLTGQRSKSQKSPKHGLGRLFASKKSKNYTVHSLKISGPAEVGILPTRVHMSEEDRKSLMLQVKHGDITQEEALNNFLKYVFNSICSREGGGSEIYQVGGTFILCLVSIGHISCSF